MSPTGGPACLLAHGFGGSPFEMLPLAHALAAAGCAVSVPVLPGHATTVEAWSRTGWDDWLDALDREYARLAADHPRVFLMGLSMGGSLALALAQKRPAAGVVAIAAPARLYRLFPWRVPDWRMPLIPILRHVRPLWPTGPGRAESRAIAPWQGYEGVVAVNPLYSFGKGLARMRRGLARVTAPLLAVHAPDDRSVPLANALEVLAGVGSKDRRLVLLDIQERITKHHLLTTHRETRDAVARLAMAFVDACGRG